ncbi:hypothetical protein EI94DRAFT_1735274 [Lactarius quietus]|nr:hypothetical protein EI94DRAFT_1735274 [Lactarius quietus]
MMDQHRHAQLLQETVQYFPKSSEGFDIVGPAGLSTHRGGLLVPDAGICDNSWNGSLSPSSRMEQDGNDLYHPTIDQMDTTVNMYTSPILGHFPNHRPTLSPSDETLAAGGHQRPFVAQYSLPDAFPGPQMRIKVSDDQFAMHSIAIRAPRNVFPCFDIDTAKSHNQTNESKAITDSMADWSDHKHSRTEEIQPPMIPFCATPFPEECSYTSSSFKCSTTTTVDASRLHTMPQEANQASHTHNEGKHLASPTAPRSRLWAPKDRGMTCVINKKPYQCSFCCAGFSQRQGLTRHRKDKHSPKKRCDFCMEFTWPKGRHYIYQRHLQEKHPGVLSSSLSTTPIAVRAAGTSR